MKISVDDQELFRLSETQKKVIANDILDVDSHCKQALQWVLNNKFEQCFKRLKGEWEVRLKEKGIQSIPLNDEAFAELVFSQEDYRNRVQREGSHSFGF